MEMFAHKSDLKIALGENWIKFAYPDAFVEI